MIRLVYFFFLFNIYSTGFAAQPGDILPVCDAKMMDTNQALDLSDYKNKVLLIDFWATWCPPCKQAMPFLNNLRNELQGKGFEIIAINVDEKLQDAQAFLKNYPVDYLMAYDSTGDCPGKYDVKAMPSSYFIDKQGKVRNVHLGFRRADENELRNLVNQLLLENK